MPRRDRTERKKQVELNEASTGTKNIKKFFSTATNTESEQNRYACGVPIMGVWGLCP